MFAEGLGLEEVPTAHEPRRRIVEGLAVSEALSILKNGPGSFKGRKLGILVTDSIDGIDGELLESLQDAVKGVGGMTEIVAPTIGGIKSSDGKQVAADQKVDGGPSVLYDAVAVIASKEGVKKLKAMYPAKCFAADAFAHAKYIALGEEAADLFHAAGVEQFDDGVVHLEDGDDAVRFIEIGKALRFWKRVS